MAIPKDDSARVYKQGEEPKRWQYSVFRLERRMLECGVTWEQTKKHAGIAKATANPVTRTTTEDGETIIKTSTYSMKTWRKLAATLGVQLSYFIDFM